jgi:regulatory protein
MRRALARAGYEAAAVDAVLVRLAEYRYLDDAGYASRLARTRLRYDGVGRHRIRQDLRLRGVDRKTADAGIAAAASEIPETEALDRAAQKYWRAHTTDEPRLRLRKLWAFLVRRGFPASLVHDRLGTLWPSWREALEGLDVPEAGDE